jgi:hypothetical protein
MTVTVAGAGSPSWPPLIRVPRSHCAVNRCGAELGPPALTSNCGLNTASSAAKLTGTCAAAFVGNAQNPAAAAKAGNAAATHRHIIGICRGKRRKHPANAAHSRQVGALDGQRLEGSMSQSVTACTGLSIRAGSDGHNQPATADWRR